MSDAERWDAKYRDACGEPLASADAGLVRALDGLSSKGRALDLAAGTGRNALELLARGYDVEAWDASRVGLEILAEHAPAVRTRVVDVTQGLPEAEPFDLVVVVSFLDRPTYGRLKELARGGGHLVLTTFTRERPGNRPSDRFCLEVGELARGIEGFETISCEEVGGRALLVARRVGGLGTL
ncbi:MAG: methyltransferase domain-containing protein [bacterium]|nr:methyltransferase domain-containing protein [bacterium]